MAENTTNNATNTVDVKEAEKNRVYNTNVNYFGCGKDFDFED